MKIATELLLADLTTRTEQHLAQAKQWLDLPLDQLNWKADPDSWSILECLEHLNLYGDFYLPEMRQQMANSKHAAEPTFKSGWLGNYFANSMLPKPKLNKMKTFKDKNPNGSQLGIDRLEKFIHQQEETLSILQEAQKVSLSKTKTGVTISNFIRLRLGDTLRVVIYHNYRHLVQAEKVLQMQAQEALAAA